MGSWLLHPSGGLGYQIRALRYRRNLWRPFVTQVEHWVNNWQVQTKHLVIVGSNAGYTLPKSFIQRFEQVTLIEPDPIARLIFRRRFSFVQCDSFNLDCFTTPHNLKFLAQQFSEAAILFSNVIGQMLSEETHQSWRSDLHSTLSNCTWASYHDVISTTLNPTSRIARQVNIAACSSTLEQILPLFWQDDTISLIDHHTFALGGENTTHQYAVWSLTPKQHHLIEWYVHR